MPIVIINKTNSTLPSNGWGAHWFYYNSKEHIKVTEALRKSHKIYNTFGQASLPAMELESDQEVAPAASAEKTDLSCR